MAGFTSETGAAAAAKQHAGAEDRWRRAELLDLLREQDEAFDRVRAALEQEDWNTADRWAAAMERDNLRLLVGLESWRRARS